MAADTRVSWDDRDNKRVNTAPAIKIERCDGAIFGTSGDYAAGVRFHEWIRAGERGRKPRLCTDFRALRLTKDGIFVVDGDDATWMPIGTEFYAIGSGAHYAIGAMARGATVKEAVEIAKEWDVYSGGAITVLELK